MRNLLEVTHELSLRLMALPAQRSQSSDQHTYRFPAPAVSQELVGPTALQGPCHDQTMHEAQKAAAERVTRTRTRTVNVQEGNTRHADMQAVFFLLQARMGSQAPPP